MLGRRPLFYDAGSEESEDRPAFVRAASGVVRVGEQLCVLQDDASFIAVVGPSGRVRPIALPRRGGRRRFEEALGNRLEKLDLEAGDAVAGPDGPRLLALGSGSLPVREVAVLIDPAETGEARVLEAALLFSAFRSALGIAREQVNLEGCVVLGSTLRLFQRGTSCAAVDFDLASVVAFLEQRSGETPAARSVHRYELGDIRGVPLGFSDAAALDDGRVVFLAVAEDTDNPVDDGTILGSRFGVIEGDRVRLVPLVSSDGEPVVEKAEGLCAIPGRPGRFWVALDPDDPDRPAELCEVEVAGLD